MFSVSFSWSQELICKSVPRDPDPSPTFVRSHQYPGQAPPLVHSRGASVNGRQIRKLREVSKGRQKENLGRPSLSRQFHSPHCHPFPALWLLPRHSLRVEVPGEGDICEGELRGKVDALADAMTLFYKDEGERCSKFLEHLERIFSIPSGSIGSTKIPGSQVISDGYVNGIHGAMVFCIECKNELSTASCEPTAQLVSYIATSFKSRVDDHPELFQRWRVPALGVTHIDESAPHFSSTLLYWDI